MYKNLHRSRTDSHPKHYHYLILPCNISLVNISPSVKLSTYILQNILSLSAIYGSVGGPHSVPTCFVFPTSLCSRWVTRTISQEILYPRKQPKNCRGLKLVLYLDDIKLDKNIKEIFDLFSVIFLRFNVIFCISRMTDKTYYAVVEFEDGLQVVPNNWLSIDLQSAVWPNFTNNKMYDKAVKLMKDPEPTWTRHLIKKIYGTYFQYAVAMKKLKDAEETSDLNSGTEREEYRKKSRKLRAAKVADSSSSNDDQSDASFLSDIPTIPTTATHVPKKIKIASSTSAQQNSAPKCLGKIKKQDDCSLQKHTNVKVFDGYLDCMTAVIDCNSNLDQHDTNLYHDFSNVGNNDNIETSNNDWIDNESLHSRFQPNFNENNTDITNSQRESIVNKTYTKVSQSYDEQKNFQRFVVGKIINLEIAMNDVKRNVKLILEKLSLDVTKEKENIDTLKDFPLKEQKDLDTVELKLQNNSDYRDEMMLYESRMLMQQMMKFQHQLKFG
ncbi:uncharacterized protein LOC105834898 isoform X3 [Monomorium pharaonis]|uniref:uncharacterized protein LOC118644739 isoform X3 n=1 Tax=Monomorium pharaonis TaxID=307658 RepID=UPI0017463D37|nr:uncharacterized protein LOC118644739 isoform X3 [Monomorium pharaonis]XP_036144921.1 uncharacterized protein LOC118646344 isoform X3 [Monomorium pharaonis]XP_036149347.1 uncharacterized protein LOC118647825 isoform X3 [Monomorium pharaonis]XP_036150919.1 uncharacterized protein LOC105834898 isoform X3 [Monomorium pharaonis]